MKKKVQVHMLPTGDITGIVMHSTGLDKIVHTKESELNAVLNIGGTSQHLYSTSDEKIEEGDYYVHTGVSPNTGKYETLNQCHKGQWEQDGVLFVDGMFAKNCRKIVATTDTSLWEHDDTVPYPKTRPALPQIPKSFIKQYVEADGKIDEVEIECENIQKTINYHKDLWVDNWIVKTDSNNCVIVYSTKDSWSKEEVIKILKEFEKYLGEYPSARTSIVRMDNWIEKNL